MSKSRCLINGEICGIDSLLSPGANRDVVYEVIRVINGKPLFLSEHLRRLRSSLEQVIPSIDFASLDIHPRVSMFLATCGMQVGNFRIELFKHNDTCLQIYEVLASYPSDEMYQNGVRLSFQKAERNNPNAKMVLPEIRNMANIMMKQEDIYETVLVNNAGYVTEGSRSNIFFIKNDTLYTAKEKDVLPGITRMKVMEICDEKGIQVIEADIHYSSLHSFDAAFMCGTSPMVLAIHQIDEFPFNPQNPLLKRISQLYHELIRDILK